MFGRLSLGVIPFENPIIMGAVGGATFLALVILALITYYRKWTYLWKEWLTSLDPKRIGIMYIILALIMLLRGFSDAILMRSQQALAAGASSGYLPPGHFDQIFSAHGSIMIVFMAMPFLAGLINIALPQQIGARDVAFPFMNSISLWLTAAGAALVMVSLAIGEFSKAGWSGYAPLTELQFSPGTGVDYWIWAFQIAGIGSLMTGINFLVTIVRMRAPGMTLMRMPMFVWTAFFTSVLMVFAFPVLTVALALLTLDRYLGMHFFTNTLGGNMMMYVNLFWIWGHPEVYIVILPAFGVFSEVAATFSGKRLFGYRSMVYATAAIMVLSFSVWLHHFFTMGAGPNVNMFFGIATMMIAIPTGVKIFNWSFTMYRGRVRFTTPMYWTVGFISTFAVGGMAGVMLSAPPADYVLHNSLFLIAHFHTMLIPGSVFGFFAGYYYWFPKMFGFRLHENLGKLAFWCWLVGFYLAFAPLYILGFMGMPRRMEHYANSEWQPLLVIAAGGVAVILLGIFVQMVQLAVSIRRRQALRDLTGDPWDGRTLEWATASPAPVYNFAQTPVVHDVDAFMDMKERGTAYERPEQYHDIELPKNTAKGLFIGALAFGTGFGMVWYIYWLAALSALGIIFLLILRASDDDTEYVLPASEIEQIENRRYQQLAAARGITVGEEPPDIPAESADIPATDVVQELRENFGDGILMTQPCRDEIPTVWVSRGKIHAVLHYLKHDAARPYRMLYDLTAVDERTRVHRQDQPAGDFSLVYQLLSFDRNQMVRIKVPLESEHPSLGSVTGIWSSANWYEREVWDMFGITFEGHPHLRRILLPSTWEGHPLRKEHPARATEMGPFRMPEDKQIREEEAMRFRPEEWGLQDRGEDTDLMFLNLGPQHPGTHGVFRVVLQLDGEEIVDAVPDIGFHHRGAEKMGERQTWHTYIPYTDRIDYLGGVMNNLPYVLAVEKLAGIEVPDRVKVIRIMLAELFRIISHLVWYGTFAQDLGMLSPVFFMFNDRERALDIVSAITGGRMHPSWFRIGGVAQDLPEGWNKMVEDFLPYMSRRLIQYDKMVMRNYIFKKRTKGIGSYTLDEAADWGVTGPGLRACGLEWDFRKKMPYSGYEQFEFDIPTGVHGDCYDRSLVRVEEMRQSLRIIRQCLENMPAGPYKAIHPLTTPPLRDRTLHDIETLINHFLSVSWGPVIPAGEACVTVEATKGNTSYYLISDGGIHAYRVRIRTPSFAHLQMIPLICRGLMVPDLLAILGNIDYVMADVDR